MASESNAPPRAVLYCFGGSVWSAPAVLTAHEKRYLSGDLLDIRDVNLGAPSIFCSGCRECSVLSAHCATVKGEVSWSECRGRATAS